LSSFEPVKVLKGRFHSSKKGGTLRKGLVVIQFAASLVLIAGTFTVYKQLNYMLGKDIGIATDYVVTFRMPAQSDDARKEQINSWNAFKEELRTHSAIERVGGTSNLPGGHGSDINSTSGDVRINEVTDYKGGTIYIQYNDDEFLDAVEMKLLAAGILIEAARPIHLSLW
jgi:putative ABC transport system permease protein